ncbi:phage portal protein [Mycobacterium sp. EPG1]|nr:phage portal protein [Mycobacterium sp. EPG1]
MFRRDPPEPETRNLSIADPGIVALFGGAPALAGVTVSERTVLGIPAVKAAVSLIAGTIAALPLHTITERDGVSQRAPSFLDDPGRVIGLTAYEWKETVLAHLLIHGNAFLVHVLGGAGQVVGLQPIHPSAVGVEIDKQGRKSYRVSLADGTTRTYTDATLTHIPALSLDGARGLSPLEVGKNTFGTSIAAERAAAKMFGNGALMSAIVTPEDDLTPEEAKEVKSSLDSKVAGGSHAGEIAVFNRKLKITPWSLSAQDAQWIQSRAFQIEEIARWFQVPPHLLAQTEKQTSWGTGVSEQNRGLARYNLEPWTTRIQERLSWLLPEGRKAEFFYSAFVEPDPETEIRLLIEQVNAGLLTVNEARKIRNLPPLPEPTEVDNVA